jgi:septation ring formation regulator EzrA
VPYIEERVSTVETDIAEIKGDVAAIKAGQSGMELKLNRVAQDFSELKAGQIEVRDLLARVVARLEGVNS